MKPSPVPIRDGAVPITPIDPAGARIYEGVRSGAYHGVRQELEHDVRALELTLPPTPVKPRRERASLTPAERRFVSPPRHTAAGARHNAVDRASIQTAHDALCALCTDGSAADGNRNP
jgi:hypothetical protein